MLSNIKIPALFILAANAAFASANSGDLSGRDMIPRSPKLDADGECDAALYTNTLLLHVRMCVCLRSSGQISFLDPDIHAGMSPNLTRVD